MSGSRCGPCGPLSFIVSTVGCHGVGVELSSAAVRVGRARAVSLGLESLLSVEQGDLNEPLPFESSSFDAVVALDVVVHLRDRLSLFREAARLLRPCGRFLFTDAGVLTGSISNEEVRARSAHGFTQFVAAGSNQTLFGYCRVRAHRDREPNDERRHECLRPIDGVAGASRRARADVERCRG